MMLLRVHLSVLTAVLWQLSTDAAPSPVVKLCGRKLGDFMGRVCHVYNSPSWDVPTVVEQQTSIVRRRRQVGIADACCTVGCTMKQLTEFCAILAFSESPLEKLDHMIADRSAEQDGVASVPSSAAVVGSTRRGETREVGRRRSRGYGRARGRRRRCWCRRKRRSGRRFSLMGNMKLIKNVVRAAPVVGTVSPLLTWGRTLNTDLPPSERDRYAYVAIYT